MALKPPTPPAYKSGPYTAGDSMGQSEAWWNRNNTQVAPVDMAAQQAASDEANAAYKKMAEDAAAAHQARLNAPARYDAPAASGGSGGGGGGGITLPPSMGGLSGGGMGGGGGAAPIIEPKPQASPASLGGLDAAMGGGGSPEGGQYLGTLPNGLRALGTRKYPMDSMALAGVQGSIY